MPSLRELRRKVRTVKSTQQITKAMKMVAAARLRRAQARILSARPFAQDMEAMMGDLLYKLVDTNQDGVLSEEELRHPLLRQRATGPRAVLLFSGDKGLCGGFNTQVLRQAHAFADETPGERIAYFVVGRKGRDDLARHGLSLQGEYTHITGRLNFTHAELIGRDVMNWFLSGPMRDVTMIYQEFRSALQQRLVRKTLLPITPPPRRTRGGAGADFLYEPDREQLLESLFARFVKAEIFRALLESAASELGARMSAMENATRNAEDLIGHLSLTANKIRQSGITREISELVGGAEALA